MYYNFVRRHQTLTERHSGIHYMTEMEAGVADHVWKLEEVDGLLETREGGARRMRLIDIPPYTPEQWLLDRHAEGNGKQLECPNCEREQCTIRLGFLRQRVPSGSIEPVKFVAFGRRPTPRRPTVA